MEAVVVLAEAAEAVGRQDHREVTAEQEEQETVEPLQHQRHLTAYLSPLGRQHQLLLRHQEVKLLFLGTHNEENRSQKTH